jgi:hypothetical protein
MEDELARACSAHREEEFMYEFGGKARKKSPLGRPRRRWVDNNKMDLREIGWGGTD